MVELRLRVVQADRARVCGALALGERVGSTSLKSINNCDAWLLLTVDCFSHMLMQHVTHAYQRAVLIPGYLLLSVADARQRGRPCRRKPNGGRADAR